MNIYPRDAVRMRSPDNKIWDRRALHNLGGRVGRSGSNMPILWVGHSGHIGQ